MNTVAVFVHLGKAPVKHLWKNLERHKQLFPDIGTYVIIDEPRHARYVPNGIEVYIFERKNSFLQTSAFGAHDQKFRRGFWRFSLERLFALEEFHQTIPDASLLHIESDILLMPNFPWSEISAVNKPLWNNYNKERDVSALLFYPNYEVHSKVMLEIQSLLQVTPNHTDMTVLAEVRESDIYNVAFFPSLHSKVPELKNIMNTAGQGLIDKVSDTTFFNDGIFDGAAIGMWFTGHDPRNNYGKAFIHDSSPISSGDSLVDPSGVNYEIDSDNNLYVISKSSGAKIQLWCLHIHSKSLKLFSSEWDKGLVSYVKLSQNPAEIPFFSKSALWGMFIQSIKGKTLLRFVIGLPLIHRFRRWLSLIKHSILSKLIQNRNLE